jgi:hypothetical protein
MILDRAIMGGMTDAITSTSASSSSASSVFEDIVRLIAPSDREGFNAMLQHALRGRELPADELRRVAERTWRQFCFHGWTRD